MHAARARTSLSFRRSSPNPRPSCSIPRAPPAGRRASCTLHRSVASWSRGAWCIGLGVDGGPRLQHVEVLLRLRPRARAARARSRRRDSILHRRLAEADAVLEIAARHAACLFSVPTMYRRLVAEAGPSAWRRCEAAPVRRRRRADPSASWSSSGKRRRRRAAEPLRHVRDVLRCMVTPAGHIERYAHRLPLEGVRCGGDVNARRAVRATRRPLGQASCAGHVATRIFRGRPRAIPGWLVLHPRPLHAGSGRLLRHQGRSDELVKIAGQWVQPGGARGSGRDGGSDRRGGLRRRARR